jgi:hypothetical protein
MQASRQADRQARGQAGREAGREAGCFSVSDVCVAAAVACGWLRARVATSSCSAGSLHCCWC